MGAEEGRRGGTWLNPSPPGVPVPGSIPPPLPSRKYARRVGTLLRAPPPAPLPAAASGWHLLASFVGASRLIRSGTWDRRERSVRSGGDRSSQSAGTGLSKPSRPYLVPKTPSESPSRFRLPSPTHILTRERGACPETPSIKSSFCPGPHYIYPYSLPPSSLPDQIRPPPLTSRFIPCASPTKLLTLPAPSPTASAATCLPGSPRLPGPFPGQVWMRGKFRVTGVF